MGIYEFLSEFGNVNYANHFNGTLSEFLQSHEDENKELFTKLLDLNEELKIFTNFELNINSELLSNKKIGYRDVNKIAKGSLKIPYILYWNVQDKQRAIILDGHNYIEARGVYYCITEPENLFEPYHLEVLANYISPSNHDEIYKMVDDLLHSESTVGYIQRYYDNKYINDIEEMKTKCCEIAKSMFDETLNTLNQMDDKGQKTVLINHTVGRAFLLKKSLYVRYMMNKYLLNDRHSGNVSEQRRFAKAYSDEITIFPYYDLWNQKNENA